MCRAGGLSRGAHARPLPPPLIYALAMQEKKEKIKFTLEGCLDGSLSMRSFPIG